MQPVGLHDHERSVLLLSWSGRPVYSCNVREGQEAHVAGVVSAILHNASAPEEEVRMVQRGNTRVVFSVEGPLYFVIRSSIPTDSRSSLERLLYLIKMQLFLVLTDSVLEMLRKKPKFDIQRLLGGADCVLDSLLSDYNSYLSYGLQRLSCFPLSKRQRSSISHTLTSTAASEPSIALSLLAYNKEVVHLCHSKQLGVEVDDLLLLLNFASSLPSLRTAESWTPVCLPVFNAKGYFYAYISFLTDGLLCLILSQDATRFHELQVVRQQLESELRLEGLLQFFQKQQVSAGNPLMNSFVAEHDAVLSCTVVSHSSSQCVTSASSDPEHDLLLLSLFSTLHDPVDASSLVFERRDSCILLALQHKSKHDILMILDPLATKEQALQLAMRLLKLTDSADPFVRSFPRI